MVMRLIPGHRIAEEAGTHKRMVLYYFRDREQLLERTVVMLGIVCCRRPSMPSEVLRSPPTSLPPASTDSGVQSPAIEVCLSPISG